MLYFFHVLFLYCIPFLFSSFLYIILSPSLPLPVFNHFLCLTTGVVATHSDVDQDVRYLCLKIILALWIIRTGQFKEGIFFIHQSNPLCH